MWNKDEYDADEVNSIRAISADEYIAGHIINRLEHLPKTGESIQEENVIFIVKAVRKNRIDQVHIRLLPKEDKDEKGEGEE